jgi:hypothetical protein
MGTSTVAEIVALKSPDYASDPRINDFDTLAKFHVAQSAFGDKWVYARALLVLHWLTLESQGGGSSSSSGSGVVGGIKSEKEGDLARSYGTIGGAINERNVYLMSTAFGAELVQLWRACLILPQSRRVGALSGIVTR